MDNGRRDITFRLEQCRVLMRRGAADRVTRRRTAQVLAWALLALSLAVSQASAKEPFTLEGVRAQVKQDYDGVAHLSTEALAAALARKDDVLLLDVREEREYAVSRIPGAVRVDPGVWSWSFLRQHAEAAKGKTVVFYCSVGVRSSRLAARVQKALKENGAKAVFNLDGGIFHWHGQERRLSNAKGETRFVHPFDRHWGQLVSRRDLARTAPTE